VRGRALRTVSRSGRRFLLSGGLVRGRTKVQADEPSREQSHPSNEPHHPVSENPPSGRGGLAVSDESETQRAALRSGTPPQRKRNPTGLHI